MEAKKTLVTGIKPTGKLHIGNYFAVIKPFLDIHRKYRSVIFVADLHALTTQKNPEELSSDISDMITGFLALGIDPKKTLIFKQSDVPEVTTLSWIFSCLTSVPYLMRAHAFKDAEAKNKEINVGVFSYPLLMAADILLPDADVVPVGLDQKQHLEITRETARKFNQTFGKTFKIPELLILKETATVLGTDGRKMSKSYKNTIGLFAKTSEIKEAVMRIPTDSKGINDPKDPKECKVFALHKSFSSQQELKKLEERYKKGGIGYKESKELLIKNIDKFIKPLREKKSRLEKKKQTADILESGKKIMRKQAEKKLATVLKKVGSKI
jgi:tryptophanyl-tRNA synthetase